MALVPRSELYSLTSGPWRLLAYSLTDPEAPVQIAAQATGSTNSAREMVVTKDGGLVVTAGFSGLKAYTFDGDSFVPAVGQGSTQYIDGLEAWPAGASVVQKVFRSLTMDGAADQLAAAYFTYDPDAPSPGTGTPAGVMLFTLAPDGSIARVDNVEGVAGSRAARFYQRP